MSIPTITVAQLDVVASAFGWTKELVTFSKLDTKDLFYQEARHTYLRGAEKVTVDETNDHAIVHFAWVQGQSFALVGEDGADSQALLQLAQGVKA